jgi:drug/metabolite transporter (DMT)-like permease
MVQKNDRFAILFAGLAMICWSTVAVAFKMALKSYTASQLLLVANFVAFLSLFIQVIMQGKALQCFQQTLKQVLFSMFLGFLNPFFYYLILFKAYYVLPAQVAQPINFIWPIMLMLLSVPLLNQKLKIVSFAALLISFSGVFILSLQGRITTLKIDEPAGVLLALSSSIIWALYWIFNVKDTRDDQLKLMMNFFFSLIYITAWCGIRGEVSGLSRSGFLPSVYSGLFEMGITFVFWIKALQYATTTARVTSLIYLTPFVSLLFIHFILHEKIYFTSVIGLILIISGIILQQYGSKEKNH